jgi:glutaminase
MKLMKDGTPHNPMINSGALMCAALIDREFPNDKRYENYSQVFHKLIGGEKVDFNNEMFLCELEHANRNRCLLYMLEEKGVLPKEATVKKTLEFYTQCSAIEVLLEDYAVLAASIANGGICPLT